MAATPEAKVKDKIKKTLAEFNVYYAMPVGSGYGRSGVPDFLCCVDGHFLAIEAKADEFKTPTALQLREIQRIRDANGTAIVIHANNMDYLRGVLKLLKGVNPNE